MCRGRELNSRLPLYECGVLPLNYPGQNFEFFYVAPLRIARRPAAYETAEVLFLQGATHDVLLIFNTKSHKKQIPGALPNYLF